MVDNKRSDGDSSRVSRRTILKGGAVSAAASLVLAACSKEPVAANLAQSAGGQPDGDTLKYPFRGIHQAGITTPAQQQMIMAAYEVTASTRGGVVALLKEWTQAAEAMTKGEFIGEQSSRSDTTPTDTGETMDSPPAGLTLTFGVGSTLFDHPDKGDRFGIAEKLPGPLAAGIPPMAAENLDPSQCGGDLVVQACSEEPLVALHAIHNLTRIAFGSARISWVQLGYGRTSSTSTTQPTARNLFGFKDGTNNIKAEDPQRELDEHLWISPDDDGGAWAAGGSYACMRKINQMMEVWDELILSEQQQIIGREKNEGAPLSGGTEFTPVDFTATGPDGEPLVPVDSHVAVVHPDNNGGARMLRRGYNFTEGIDYLGRLKAGLFFIAYVRNPQTNFVPILAKMKNDQLTEYLQHTSSSLFLMLPGLQENQEYLGQTLFT